MEKEAAIKRFQEFLRIRTVSTEGPNTGAYQQAVIWLEGWARDLGLAARVVEPVAKKPILIATWHGSDASLPAVLLNSHYDVVPAMEDKWKMPAWEARTPHHTHTPPLLTRTRASRTLARAQGKRTAEGRIYGRGAQDMKCVCVQYLLAIAELKASGFTPLRTVAPITDPAGCPKKTPRCIYRPGSRFHTHHRQLRGLGASRHSLW